MGSSQHPAGGYQGPCAAAGLAGPVRVDGHNERNLLLHLAQSGPYQAGTSSALLLLQLLHVHLIIDIFVIFLKCSLEDLQRRAKDTVCQYILQPTDVTNKNVNILMRQIGF